MKSRKFSACTFLIVAVLAFVGTVAFVTYGVQRKAVHTVAVAPMPAFEASLTNAH